MKIAFFTNVEQATSLGCVKRLIRSGEDKLTVVSVVSVQRIRLFRWIKDYGLLVLVKKCLLKMKTEFLRFVPCGHQGQESYVSYLKSSGIDLIRIWDINSPSSIEQLKTLSPDVIIICTFSSIVSSNIIKIPPQGIFNLHASLLPKYRGPTPVFWALYHGDPTTGITIHKVSEGIDSGDIVDQRETSIEKGDTIESLEVKLMELAADGLEDLVKRLKGGPVEAQAQVEKGAYAHRPTKKDWAELSRILEERHAK